MQVSALKNKLKKQSTATGDGVARAFLRAQAALFGSYRDALRYKPVSILFHPYFNLLFYGSLEWGRKKKHFNITHEKSIIKVF